MTKRVLALLLAGALGTVGLASCKKKAGTEAGDDRDYEEIVSIADYERVASADAAGNAQKNAQGVQIYDRFTYESLDDRSVRVTNFYSEVRESDTSYLRDYTEHTVVIPATLGGKTVAEIGERAFSGRSEVSAVVFPAGVTAIRALAFAQCSRLTALTLPAGVSEIGDSAFYECTALASVRFAELSELRAIPAGAFQKCTALTEISVPGYIETIGQSAFLACTGLKTVTVAEGVKTIGKQSFGGLTALENLTLPASLTSIGELNFYISGAATMTAANVTVPAGSLAEDYVNEIQAGTPPLEAMTASAE